MQVAIIGAGGLGGALIGGLAAAGFEVHAADLDEKKLEEARANARGKGGTVETSTDASAAAGAAGVVVVAVKPQAVEPLLKGLGLGPEKLVISCAAGVPLAKLEAWTGARVARVMPNIGAAVGLSTTAMKLGSRGKPSDTDTVEAIFRAVGEVVWLAREDDLHTATAVAGSGPAFVLVALEAMEDAAVAAGVPRAEARLLARGAFQAAAALAEPGVHPADLRARVTSPGGTTAAGLFALEEGGARAAFQRAVAAATARSRELAGE